MRGDSFEQLTSVPRFTTAITNSGSADFRPAIPKLAWDWHACHQHYHSMEVFSHFEIMDQRGRRVVEGHKVLMTCMSNSRKKKNNNVSMQASFCLEDNDCEGVEPNYDCANYGDQGITAGCKDIYYYNIDCQWIDITDLDVGKFLPRKLVPLVCQIPFRHLHIQDVHKPRVQSARDHI